MYLVGCDLVVVAVGRGAPWPVYSSLWGPSSQTLTLLGGARLIAWRVRGPLKGISTGAETFLSRRVRLSYGLKKPCATLMQLVGRSTNTTRPAITHFDRPCLGKHGPGWVCPGSSASQLRCALTSILDPLATVAPGSNPPWRSWVYHLSLEAPFFSRLPTGPEALLDPPRVSLLIDLRLEPPKKGLILYLSVWFDSRQISARSATALCRGFSADCITSQPDGECFMADLRPNGPRVRQGHLQVGELHHWHICHPCIALNLAVQFKL